MQEQHKPGQLGGAGSGLQTPEALARTLSGHRRTSTWTPGSAATGGTHAPGTQAGLASHVWSNMLQCHPAQLRSCTVN